MSNKTSSGMSFTGALFLIFLTLKLTGVITWSWWWVTCPLWIGFLWFALLISFVAIGGIVALIAYTIKAIFRR